MAFEVDDVEAAVAELRRRGVELLSELVDIEGNVLGISQLYR